MQFHQKPRAGFTLIELLVVIAIVALLIGLLLPAVQQAREAARRTQCKNHLKQLGLAFQNYESAHQVFPPGFIAGSTDLSITSPGWGWGAMLLPYLDQAPLYNSLNFDLPIQDPSNSLPIQTVLPAFLCPSDLYPEGVFSITSDAANTVLVVKAPPSSYVGCVGDGLTSTKSNATVPWDGVLYRDSSTRIADITDGTSNTLMVGEKAWAFVNTTWVGAPNTGLIRAGSLNAFAPHVTSSAADFVLSHADGINSFTDAGMDSFTSLHTTGAFFLFADGSVQFLQNVTGIGGVVGTSGIYETFQAYSTRAGGEIVTSP